MRGADLRSTYARNDRPLFMVCTCGRSAGGRPGRPAPTPSSFALGRGRGGARAGRRSEPAARPGVPGAARRVQGRQGRSAAREVAGHGPHGHRIPAAGSLHGWIRHAVLPVGRRAHGGPSGTGPRLRVPGRQRQSSVPGGHTTAFAGGDRGDPRDAPHAGAGRGPSFERADHETRGAQMRSPVSWRYGKGGRGAIAGDRPCSGRVHIEFTGLLPVLIGISAPVTLTTNCLSRELPAENRAGMLNSRCWSGASTSAPLV